MGTGIAGVEDCHPIYAKGGWEVTKGLVSLTAEQTDPRFKKMTCSLQYDNGRGDEKEQNPQNILHVFRSRKQDASS
jgi:hypothetical protein